MAERTRVSAALMLLVLAACQRTSLPPPPQGSAVRQDAGSITSDSAGSDSAGSNSADSGSASSETGRNASDLERATDSQASTRVAAAFPIDRPGEEGLAAPVTEVSDGSTSATGGDAGTPAAGELTNATGTSLAGAEPTVAASGNPPVDAEAPAERIALLAPGGPIIVDVKLRLRGGNIDAALSVLVEEVFQAADVDGDGNATWAEVADSPRFRSGQYGNLVADTEEERRQLIRIYDTNHDGFVNREELPRFITRNAGGGRSFSLRSSNEFRGSNRRRSPTRLLIDQDRDGAITGAEIDAAPQRLLSRDMDDDEVVVLAELKDSANEMLPQPATMSNRRRVSEPETAIWLTNKSIDVTRRWGMVQFQLQELYAFGGEIGRADLPLTPELFKYLDADNDGQLNRTDIARLADASPHLVLDVHFDGVGDAELGPRINLVHAASELLGQQPNIRELPMRLSIQLPNIALEFFVNEDDSLANVIQTGKSQFAALDRNRDGYLEADEAPQIPGVDASFESLDADSDGKVYEQELVAYMQQRSLVARAQIRARAADQEDALFTALDTDGDGRLNAREIRQAPAILRSIDRNGDGKVQSDEIPGSMVIAFVRGNPQQDERLFSAPMAAPRSRDQSIPRWFRGMDGNGDGEISAREFFGARDTFQQLDVDRDGFLSLDEARAIHGTPAPPP